jgi:sortase B
MIIYGHNTSNGEMFGGLRHFLDKDYLAEHPEIVLEVDGIVNTYKIFNARKSNIHDPAYNLSLDEDDAFASFKENCGAPADAVQIITLSTCVSGNDDDERVIIQAAKI